MTLCEDDSPVKSYGEERNKRETKTKRETKINKEQKKNTT
jgi:hypothetical protein